MTRVNALASAMHAVHVFSDGKKKFVTRILHCVTGQFAFAESLSR